MHYQIRNIINRLVYRNGEVYVVLSAPEQSPLGRIVGRAYYNSNVLTVMNSSERWGYPHNGGEHSLSLRCPPLDAIEMIEMIKEDALAGWRTNEEERQVANELSYVSQEIHVLRSQARAQQC